MGLLAEDVEENGRAKGVSDKANLAVKRRISFFEESIDPVAFFENDARDMVLVSR